MPVPSCHVHIASAARNGANTRVNGNQRGCNNILLSVHESTGAQKGSLSIATAGPLWGPVDIPTVFNGADPHYVIALGRDAANHSQCSDEFEFNAFFAAPTPPKSKRPKREK